MDNNPLTLAQARLLEPVGVGIDELGSVLGQLSGDRVDLGDIYLEATRSESWSLEDGIVKEGVHSIRHGAGVRAVAGEQTGFAYSDDLTIPALNEAANAARAISRQGQSGAVRLVAAGSQLTPLYMADDPITSAPTDDKLDTLRRIDQRLRAADPRVAEVMVGLSGQHTAMMVLNSDGTLAADVRPLVRMNVTVIVEHQGRRESATYGGGGRSGYAALIDEDQANQIADEALRQALVSLERPFLPNPSLSLKLLKFCVVFCDVVRKFTVFEVKLA